MNLIECLLQNIPKDDDDTTIGYIKRSDNHKYEYLHYYPHSPTTDGYWIIPHDMVICYNDTVIAALDEIHAFLLDGYSVPCFSAMPFPEPIPLSEWLSKGGRKTFIPKVSNYYYIGQLEH